MKCQSHILRTYKTRKAEPIWPETTHGPNLDAQRYPVCGGNVTVKVKVVNEPEWGGNYAKMELEWTCTNCKMPWVPSRFELERAIINGSLEITQMADFEPIGARRI